MPGRSMNRTPPVWSPEKDTLGAETSQSRSNGSRERSSSQRGARDGRRERSMEISAETRVPVVKTDTFRPVGMVTTRSALATLDRGA